MARFSYWPLSKARSAHVGLEKSVLENQTIQCERLQRALKNLIYIPTCVHQKERFASTSRFIDKGVFSHIVIEDLQVKMSFRKHTTYPLTASSNMHKEKDPCTEKVAK